MAVLLGFQLGELGRSLASLLMPHQGQVCDGPAAAKQDTTDVPESLQGRRERVREGKANLEENQKSL